MLGSSPIDPARLQWRARGSSDAVAGRAGSPTENERVTSTAPDPPRARSVTAVSISPDARSTVKPGGPADTGEGSSRAAWAGSDLRCLETRIVARTAPTLLTNAE